MYNDLPLKTLVKGEYPDRWYPVPVYRYKLLFHQLDTGFENSQALISNLAYSMQYLEYLEKQISEFNLSSVLYSMCVKSFVITGMSIIEGIFVCIVKSNGWWKKSDMESLGSTITNEKSFGGHSYIIRTELFSKVAEHPLPMTLDELITRLNRHHEALGVHHNVYPQLRRLRNLRNRIHLQKTDSPSDHDYNAFDYRVLKEMKGIIYEIVSAVADTELTHYYDFLK